MEVQGRLIKILDPVEGESANGKWKRQDFLIETNAQYPRKICITINNDRISLADFSIGENVTVSINIESREYNGRWMTNFRAWKIEKGIAPQSTPMEIQGTVIQAMEPRTGTSANGKSWTMQEFVIETNEQFNPKVNFTVWGGRISSNVLANGNFVTITVDIESREGKNGGWFSSVQAWKAIVSTPTAQNTGNYGVETQPQQTLQSTDIEAIKPTEVQMQSDDDALPF